MIILICALFNIDASFAQIYVLSDYMYFAMFEKYKHVGYADTCLLLSYDNGHLSTH